MGTLEAPQDTHGQDTGRGPPERNGQMEAKAVVFMASARPPQPEFYYQVSGALRG